MSRIIVFSGAHGVGKSYSCKEYVSLLNKSEDRYTIGIIDEAARSCPFPVLGKGSAPSIEGQCWMFSSQAKSELEAVVNYPLTVSDRCLVDYVAYSFLAGFEDLARAQLELARHHIGYYDTIYFKHIIGNPYLLDDGFRSTDVKYQMKAETILLELYNTLNIPLIPVTSVGIASN